ncbi:MAG: HD domain-containing protein [Ruminococcus sp.]|nr:HD domain-containing protein [Ruminococcus sp.]
MKINVPPYVSAVISRLERSGFQAYMVGGCVRDSLMGKEPHDYDICTDALPEEMLNVFGDFHTIATGLKHGTLTVMSDHFPVEVTTFRSDGDYTDHRRPDFVRFERELSEDLKRRDLTVNAMCYNEKQGLVDLFGGADDLNSGIIRCVGRPEERFSEDALRIMRAMRFASVLDFRIEEGTAAAMRTKADLLRFVSAERIFTELKKLLCGPAVERVLLGYKDLMALIIPELGPCIGCGQNCVHHCFDVYGHICRSVAEIEPDEELRLTMLFHDIGKPLKKTTDAAGADHFKLHPLAGADIAERVLSRMKSSRKTVRRVVPLVLEHDNRIPARKKSVKRLISKYDYDFMTDWLKVRRADTLAQSEHMRAEKLAELDRIEELVEEIKAENSCLKLSDLAVNGTDLMAMGIQGRAIKERLNAALEAVIDERVPNEREALLGYIGGLEDGEEQ